MFGFQSRERFLKTEAAWSGKDMRKDKVMRRHSAGGGGAVLWHRGSSETVEATIRRSCCLLMGDGRWRSLSTKGVSQNLRGNSRVRNVGREMYVCLLLHVALCYLLWSLKWSDCFCDSLESLYITWFDFMGPWREKLSLRCWLWLSSGKEWVETMGIRQQSQGLNRCLCS